MSKLIIEEISPSPHDQRVLKYDYETDSYYDIQTIKKEDSWSFSLGLKKLGKKITKISDSELFKPFVENPKIFQCSIDNQEAGILHLGFDEWNQRLRIWDILVTPKYRGQGVGTRLMQKTFEEARNFNARMIVLETQSCNVPAIKFYVKHGFDLIGFDTSHYSNRDIEQGEIRLEFGHYVQKSRIL